MFLIKSKTDGFRRCGVAHTKAGKEFADDFFTEKQLDQLEVDPMIIVAYIKEPEIKSDPEPENIIVETGFKPVSTREPKAKKPKTKGK